MSEPTIFERIIAREIPADIVFEDDDVIAFRDIAPKAPLHVLVVPKAVYRDVAELAAADPALLARVVTVGRQIASDHADGDFRLIFNSGAGSGQTVFHVHGHVLAGGLEEGSLGHELLEPARAELEVDGVAMVRLLGPQDRLLSTIEGSFPGVSVLVRGNRVTLEGPREEVSAAERLVEELIELVRSGVDLGPVDVTASARILERGQGSPAEVLSQAILTTRGKSIRPKTLGQKAYVDAIDENTIVFGIGPAGTGKTYLAMAKAVQALQRKEVERIILSRPAIEAGERLGFLPGTLNDKIDPYLRPLYDALNEMMDPEIVPKLLAAGTVEVAPLAYMRGRTLNNAFVVLDEAQNTTPEQMKMFLTRLGFGTRMVVTGDITQVDLPAGASGLQLVTKILEGMDDIHFSRLTSEDVVRHSLVAKIVDAYTRYDARKQARDFERREGNPDGTNRAERRGHAPQDHKPGGPERPRRRRP